MLCLLPSLTHLLLHRPPAPEKEAAGEGEEGEEEAGEEEEKLLLLFGQAVVTVVGVGEVAAVRAALPLPELVSLLRWGCGGWHTQPGRAAGGILVPPASRHLSCFLLTGSTLALFLFSIACLSTSCAWPPASVAATFPRIRLWSFFLCCSQTWHRHTP